MQTSNVTERSLASWPRAWVPALALGLVLGCGAGGGKGAAESAPTAAVKPAPSVTRLEPPEGPVGTTLVLHGENLEGVTEVRFTRAGGAPGTGPLAVKPERTGAREAVVVVPPEAGSGPLEVVAAPGGPRPVGTFTVLPAPGPTPPNPDPVVTPPTPPHPTPDPVIPIPTPPHPTPVPVVTPPTPPHPTPDPVIPIPTPPHPTPVPVVTLPTPPPPTPVPVVTPPTPVPGVTPPTPPDPTPTITSVDPMKVGPGKWVTIRGSGFDAVPAATFGALPVDPAGVRRLGPDHLEVRVPVLARKSGAFQLVFGAGTVASPTLTLRFGKPVVTGITPMVGRVGDRVEITGTNLASATKIYFGAASTQGFEVHLDPERLWVVVPPRAETGPVQVKTRGSKELAGLAGASGALFRVQPVIASILPPSAPPGARVTLVGSGLYLPIGDLGVAGQWTRPLEISPDHTRLEFRVPSMAVPGGSGPVAWTLGGTTTRSAVDFTVAPFEAPMVTGMNPTHGVPGARVVLTGHGLGGVTEVTYGGAPLRPGSWKVRESFLLPDWPEIEVLVPLGAASARFRVSNPAGHDDSPPFTVADLTSRTDLLGEALVVRPGWNPIADYPAPDRAEIYQFLGFPRAPLFHAYHPDYPDDPEGAFRPGHLWPTRCSLSMTLPGIFEQVLPAGLETCRAGLATPVAAPLELRVVVQDQPYAAKLRMRPQYWLFPDAPQEGMAADSQDRPAGMGLFADPVDPAPPSFEGHAPGSWIQGEPTRTSVHCEDASKPNPNLMVASPCNLAVDPLDPTVSHVFWSLVQDVSCPWRPGRAVATLHLLLTDAERQAFDEVIHREDTAFLFPGSTPPPPLTFVRLLEALHADPVLDGTPAFRSLAALVSPRIFMATPGAVTTAGFHRFTVTGSGFLGAVGVTVDGVAAGDLHVIDDVRLEVAIPDSPAAVPRVLRVIRVPEVVEGVLTI